MYQVMSKTPLNNETFLMEIHAPRVAKHARPGQFIILRKEEFQERIPLTIVSRNKEAGTIELIVQMLGHSTTQLGLLHPGDFVLDFMGPLGQPTVITSRKRVLGIAGGIGSGPLLPQLEAFKEIGAITDCLLGGRSQDHLFLQDRFEAFCEAVYIATNDGSVGVKGFVTDALINIDLLKYDEFIVIGPAIMMKAVVDLLKDKTDAHINVSLNPIMIDGSGMCGECRVSIGKETKFACIHGPDFDGRLVDFDELMFRQKMYVKEENHLCKMNLGDANEK